MASAAGDAGLRRDPGGDKGLLSPGAAAVPPLEVVHSDCRGSCDPPPLPPLPPPLSSPAAEEALYWRVVCDSLAACAKRLGGGAASGGGAARSVGAASAGEALEALDAALPPSTLAACDLVSAHARAAAWATARGEAGGGAEGSPGGAVAGAGAVAGVDAGAACERACCAARQLLRLTAACCDLSDASAAASAQRLADGLLRAAPARGAVGRGGRGDWEAAVVAFAAAAHGGARHAAPSLLAACLDLASRAAAAEAADDAEDAEAAEGGAVGGAVGGAAGGAVGGAVGCGGADLWVQSLGVAVAWLRAAPPSALPPSVVAVLRESLATPGVLHGCAGVRCQGVALLGLVALRTAPTAPTAPSDAALLCSAASVDALRVRCTAARALCDLALVWGVPSVDAHRPPHSPTLLARLGAWMDEQPQGLPRGEGGEGGGEEEEELQTVAAEGAAKLLLAPQGAHTALPRPARRRLAARLLALSAGVDEAACPRLGQCLAAALPLLAHADHDAVAHAVRPALRAAARRPAAAARRELPRLAGAAAALLATPPPGDPAAAAAHPAAALALLSEALRAVRTFGRCAAVKAYAGAVVRCACATAPAADTPRLRALAAALADEVGDAAAARALRAWAQRTAPEGDEAQPPQLGEADLQRLCDAVGEAGAEGEEEGEAEGEGELPFAKAGAAKPKPRAAKASPAAAQALGPRTTHSRGRVAAMQLSDSEDESDDDSDDSDDADADADEGHAQPAAPKAAVAAPDARGALAEQNSLAR